VADRRRQQPRDRSAMSGAGTRFTRRGISSSIASVTRGDAKLGQRRRAARLAMAASRSKKCSGLRASRRRARP